MTIFLKGGTGDAIQTASAEKAPAFGGFFLARERRSR
jgi:hypothetical protein